jgi:hypothetical protein
MIESMKKPALFVLVLALGAGLSGLAWADSPLADAARKEKKRRAATKDPGKVHTNEDLGPASNVGAAEETPAEDGAKPAEGTAPAAEAKAPDNSARRDEIQREINAQVERIKGVRKQVDDAERELADMLAPSYGPRRAQMAQIRDDGQKAIAEMEARIAELEAEARRLGVTVTRPQ